MNRTYEIMFIVRPDVEEADLDKLIEGFSENVTDGGGEVKSVEKMGRRRLAYTVRKFNDGFYVLLIVAAQGSLITEIERRLRVSEQVIKFITVRMDEEEKRLAKVKALRDTKVKRSAQPMLAPQAAGGTMPRLRTRKSLPTRCCAVERYASETVHQRFSFSPTEICDDGLTASHDATQSPHFASTRIAFDRMFRDSNAGLERGKA